MGQYSFDIVSEFNKAEMHNVFDQTVREIAARYDFKGTSASLEWLPDKKGLKITGDNQFQLDSTLDIVRKKAATRGVSQKTFDASREPTASNLHMTWEILFVQGLDQEKAKIITGTLRNTLPKLKTQIQGNAVRVTSPKKDELQAAMSVIREADFVFPTQFTNFR